MAMEKSKTIKPGFIDHLYENFKKTFFPFFGNFLIETIPIWVCIQNPNAVVLDGIAGNLSNGLPKNGFVLKIIMTKTLKLECSQISKFLRLNSYTKVLSQKSLKQKLTQFDFVLQVTDRENFQPILLRYISTNILG